MTTNRVIEIRRRLQSLKDTGQMRRWQYNPKHKMYVGTTYAIEEPYTSLAAEDNDWPNPMVFDLGRAGGHWAKDETGAYKLTKQAQEEVARREAMGRFLESCREDIEFLLDAVEHPAPCLCCREMQPCQDGCPCKAPEVRDGSD